MCVDTQAFCPEKQQLTDSICSKMNILKGKNLKYQTQRTVFFVEIVALQQVYHVPTLGAVWS